MPRERRATPDTDPLDIGATDLPAVMTIPEAMKALSTSEYKIREMIKDRDLEAVRLGKRGLRIKTASIARLLNTAA